MLLISITLETSLYSFCVICFSAYLIPIFFLIFVVRQGAYIPKVLRASPSFESPSDLSYRNFGYQSFGSTDRMGRKSSSTSPTDPHHLSSTVATQKQSSTLERCAKKLKGGAGAGTNESASAKKDDVSPKSFV